MSEISPHCFRWERRVEFCETDAAGIVHFSSFFLYMEQAEHAMFRAMGSTIFPANFFRGAAPSEFFRTDSHDRTDSVSPPITWPRVRCECEYFAPARFEDTLSIFVGIERLGAKSVTYAHHIQLAGTSIARGRVVAVCSAHDTHTGRLVGCLIPESIRSSLRKFLIAADSSDAP